MAGKITTNSVVLGDSITDTQNFVLKTNADGTATLARGALGGLGTVLTVDASSNVGIGTASPVSFGANTHSLTLDGTGSYNGVAWKSNGTTVALGYTNSTAGFILGTEGAIPLSLATNGTERMRIDAVGNVTLQNNISVGGAAPTTSGTGITFPATQSASSNANTLDDYEEGTWTPVITSGTGSITSYTSSGIYVKVGRMVTLNMSYVITNNGTGATYGQISNFPFMSSTTGGGFSSGTRIAGTTGNTCTLTNGVSSTTGALWTYSNTYPWANNAGGDITITYQTS